MPIRALHKRGSYRFSKPILSHVKRLQAEMRLKACRTAAASHDVTTCIPAMALMTDRPPTVKVTTTHATPAIYDLGLEIAPEGESTK